MDPNVVTTIINNVGFPIATFFVCAWYINKQSDNHKEEIGKITEALNNNTVALTKLVERLGGEDEDKHATE